MVAWWGDDPTPVFLTAQQSALRLAVQVPAQPPGTPFDPTQAGYGWVAELAPATHTSRRLVPTQPPRLADQSQPRNDADPTVLWLAGWTARAVPATHVDRRPWPQQRELESDPLLTIPPVPADPLFLHDRRDVLTPASHAARWALRWQPQVVLFVGSPDATDGVITGRALARPRITGRSRTSPRITGGGA
jgi:hypothetical protein